MEIDIQKIIEAIGTMSIEKLDQIMTAIEARLDELEQPANPNARTIREAIRAARGKGTSKGGVVLNIKRGMKEGGR